MKLNPKYKKRFTRKKFQSSFLRNANYFVFNKIDQSSRISLVKSYGQTGQRVLDRYEALIAVLDGIFLQKQEPAVRDLRDELIKPTTIATLCILTDVTMMTNTMQKYPQSSRLNFLDIPREKVSFKQRL